MHIQRWFAIESPKEMSEVFMLASAYYYIAEAGGRPMASAHAIEQLLEQVEDASEWFAASMYIEDLRQNQPRRLRWSAVR